MRCSCLKRLRQLADGGGLARPVHAHHQDHRRRLGDPRHGALGGLQNFEQVLADQSSQFAGVAHLVALHALADALQNLVGGADADVGGDQRVLQLVQQVGVDFLLALQRVFERAKPGRRASSARRSSAFREAGLLFDGAE